MRGLPGKAAHALAVAADAVAAEREGPIGVTWRAAERLAGLVAWARTASPYYRELFRGLPERVTDPAVLPPVRKRELMARFDDWVTDPAVTLDGLQREFLPDLSLLGTRYLDRYHVFTTSGTTGEPAVLLHDAESWLVLQLLSRVRLRHALTPREARAVFRPGVASAAVVATGGHFGAVTLAESVRGSSAFLARHIRVLSVLRPVEEIVAELNALQPTFISGYPSVLAVLAAEQRAGRLRICPALAFAAGELLTPAVRSEVLETLGCRVVAAYAASEAPALSVQCREGAFHVNADWYLLEAVDDERRPVPTGTLSATVLVTNLANRVQPMIRYDLGDRVRFLPEPCRCGSRLPAVTVEGRTDDTLVFRRDGRSVAVLPLALGTVVEETPGVHRFQVVRSGPARLSVRLEPVPGADAGAVWREVERRLRGWLATQGLGDVDVVHEPEPPRTEPRSGKLRQVVAELSEPCDAIARQGSDKSV